MIWSRAGGRVVAGSNPVTPTGERGKILIIKPLFYFSTLFSTLIYEKLHKKQLIQVLHNSFYIVV